MPPTLSDPARGSTWFDQANPAAAPRETRGLWPAGFVRGTMPADPQPPTARSARPRSPVPDITLDSAAGPLVIDLAEGSLISEFRGPAGVAGAAAFDLVTRAVSSPGHGPPLSAHVVPGDRVVIAVAGDIPQAGPVTDALEGCLMAGGVSAADIAVLQAEPLFGSLPAKAPRAQIFDPSVESATAYLFADTSARPLYFSRSLVDADVVVAVGSFGWDAALRGRSPEGELWPAFGRGENRAALIDAIARRGQAALRDWRSDLHDVTWQLGVAASLRLVDGADGSLHAAWFGHPEEATRLARRAAAGWRPRIEEPADLAIAALGSRPGSFADLVRGVSAAARLTVPDATICVVGSLIGPPGVVVSRWRQGTPLKPLLREAIGSRDPALAADAVDARLLARSLGDRRLVLLCGLEESVVEELEFGHAADGSVVERLANQAERVAVLHQAERMFPGR